MKQIKVYITAEQWAEKRLQVITKSPHVWKEGSSAHSVANCDLIIEQCGFELIESETKPEQPQIEPPSNGQNTDVHDKDVVNTSGDIYQPLFNYLQDWCNFIAIQDEMNTIVNLCRPIIEHLDKPDEVQHNSDEIPADKVEAVKYFLNQLPEGYKERALAQVDEERVKEWPLSCKMINALVRFSVWAKTKERYKFWNDVSNHFAYPTKYPTLPPLPND